MLSAFAFNFVVNAALSFAGAWAVVWLALRLFRPAPGRAQLWILMLPWLKLGFDAARGIPEGSFFWQRLSGVRQDLGSFRVGFGFNHWGPLVQFRLGALRGGRLYSQSAAEVLHSGLARLWPALPGVLAGLTLAVSVGFVVRRSHGWVRHARAQGAARLLHTELSLRAGRSVPILIDPAHYGAPYASGVLRPRVVFSAGHLAKLSAEERDACLLHELSHIEHRDTLWAPLLDLLSDMFWFLPGSGWVVRRFRSVLELRADAAAVRAGASAGALASALVSTAELMHEAHAPGVGLLRERLLQRRVRCLLEPGTEPPPRAGFQNGVLRILLAALLISTVLQAVFFGNQALR